jgi:tellurite resistance protein TerC
MDIIEWLWIIFSAAVILLLILDLLVFNRKSKKISLSKALLLSGFWVVLSLLFCVFLYMHPSLGVDYGKEFLTGYLIELSLSVDNLFVILSLFTIFKTPLAYQHKVLFLGILGAIVFRVIFILVGFALLEKFSWFIYVLGLILIATSFKMLFSKEEDETNKLPSDNSITKIFKKIILVTDIYYRNRFFVNIKGKVFATPLLLVLVSIEGTDILFALDSIPAVLGVSKHSFIVYSSNICAVLGLRSMFFALSGLMGLFQYLKYGLSVILFFVGSKIILSELLHQHISTELSLSVIVSIIAITILASVVTKTKNTKQSEVKY